MGVILKKLLFYQSYNKQFYVHMKSSSTRCIKEFSLKSSYSRFTHDSLYDQLFTGQ